MMKAETYPNLIDGAEVKGVEVIRNINPSDLDDTVGLYAQGGQNDVDSAVHAARRAAKIWGTVSPQMRFDLLDRVGTRLIEEAKQLGYLLSREEGKTLKEGVGEVVRAGQVFKFFAGEALRQSGETLASVRPGVDVETFREPLGVVGLITPWNFPMAIPAWKMAPALAYGNAVVFKPASLVCASAWSLVKLIYEQGAPAGLVNLVMGRGSVIGGALVEHEEVDALSFTGSVKTGQRLITESAKRQKKIQCEMGGKNPLVVLEDADPDRAVAAAIEGGFYAAGQRCTASSRLILHEDIHDAFVERFIEAMKALRVGHALEEETDIGPVVDADQLSTDERYIALAREEGCEVIGGRRLDRPKQGYYLEPALFLNARNTMRIAQEEIFGPCVTVLKAHDFEEALSLANDTAFGLSSSIFTQNLKYARAFKHGIKTGMTMVNLPTAGVDYHTPFGGVKDSSYGPREQGRAALEFYTRLKTAYTWA